MKRKGVAQARGVVMVGACERDVQTAYALIAASSGGVSRAELLAATGVSEAAWVWVRKMLLRRGDVTSRGRGRAVRYFLAAPVDD